ncbi:hypothetical protein N0V83_001856 [Neocucurbitaria cava]|uniref:Uncharacterized protein n=1 Tax=Neocucurbitaria cava TaxID=798079 RepID=A0A9W9CPI2_9PLEO|nr:hypothetical protein N0V83_001856 [Neocucurbitaria cava]
MSSSPFVFGAGANHSFSGVSTSQSSTSAPPAQAAPASVMEDLLRAELDVKMAAVDRLGVELARAERAATVALSAESVARSALNALRNTIKEEKSRMDDYDRVVKLQADLDQVTAEADGLRKEVRELQGQLGTTTANLHSQAQQVAEKDSALEGLRAQVGELKQAVEDEKATTANVASSLENAYADLTTTDNARKSALKEKDDAEAAQHDTTLQFEALHVQWKDAQAKVEELEDQMDAMRQLENENAGLYDDMENLRRQLADHERTLIVKDERISHLETQFQKERQRNLNAADAADAAASTSPIDAPPQPFNSLGDSLEEELANTSDYTDSVYEPLEYSDVVEIADFEPITPAPGLLKYSNVLKIANIEPITPASSLTPLEHSNVLEIADFKPITPASGLTPLESSDVLEIADFQPITPTSGPASTLSIIQGASIAPMPHQLITTSTPMQTDAPPAGLTQTKKPSFFDNVLPSLLALLAFFFITQYAELQAWKTANGAGYRPGYGSTYDRTGAYGNGRYLFNIIPLAMDVGNTWWSEPVARNVATAITRFETWAGIAYTPLY